MLKEEVDDLSHLAPTPGDACIPLDETTSFLASYEELNDLIDNYIYGDGATGFEAADLPAATSASSSSSGSSQSTQHSHQQQQEAPESFFNEPKRQEMTMGSGCSLAHNSSKPVVLLKDAIISENVFAAAGLTVGHHSQMLSNEDLHLGSAGLDLMIESAAAAVANEKKMDPFITYRDESSDASVATSHLLSPDDCSMQVRRIEG